MKRLEQFFRLAAIISALPNTISNGQTADATPLMADLNHIVNQVNANAADATLVALLAAANSFTAVQSGLAATAAANFPIASQIQNSVFLTLTSTLGTNTITARCAQLTLSALANGQIFTFVPSQTNTGPVTLNPDGVGATTLFLGGTNVTSGQVAQNVPLAVRYESPNFHLLRGTFGREYTSADQTITTAGQLTLAHGLGVAPTLVQMRLKCIAGGGEAGYTQNQEIAFAWSQISASQGIAVVANATNLLVSFGNNANVFSIAHATSGNQTNLTNASWNVIFKAWA